MLHMHLDVLKGSNIDIYDVEGMESRDRVPFKHF